MECLVYPFCCPFFIGCSINQSNIAVRLEFFQHRKLLNGAYGTKGNLAIRYREIFLRELDNYDTFIVQEDDVIFSENIVAYFYTWLYFLQNHTNGKLLLGLYGETFFCSGYSIDGRSLILTRDLI